MLQGSVFGSMIRTSIRRHASRLSGSAVGRQFHVFSQSPTNTGAISGLIRSLKIETPLQPPILGYLGMKLGLIRVVENVPLSCALNFRSFIHFGEQTEVEAEKSPRSMDQNRGSTNFDRNTRVRVNTRPPLENEAEKSPTSMDHEGNLGSTNFDCNTRVRVSTRPPLENEATSMNFYQNLLGGSTADGGLPLRRPEVRAGGISRPMEDFQGVPRNIFNRSREGSGSYHPPPLESQADIVHIKLMRNNSYVTLTDYKGNRKLSVSAGQVAPKGDKPGRYSGEAAAEYMGRAVKQMKIRSVVVKVSGYTFFRRKKDAILAFKDGYTHSRGDVNPVVYIEDTTRKPHNGCRLPKSRRI